MRIVDYFARKSVFLTGSTGFIGKVLIEKLLRCCPGLENIYVLIRGKKGKSAQERLMNVVQNPLFDVLRKTNPTALDKLVAVEGDIAELKLGISDKDRQLLIEKVNYVYHIAASVRFDDHLRDSVFVNIRSTREIIELAYELRDLKTFVYVSTTYCNADKFVVEEKVYPSHGNWEEIIKVAEECDPTILEMVTKKYIEPMPNTYTFAKGLAECAVVDMCKGRISAIIVRPSVVVSTYFDPIPGWNDNLNGPVGLLVAGGKGLLRVVYGHPDSVQDCVLVDAVVRVLIITLVEKVKKNDVKEIEVYNCNNFTSWSITLKELIQMGAKIIDDVPTRDVLWYPRFSLTTCWYNFYFQVLLFHMIPAICLDLGLKLAGIKTMFFKVQRKIYIANSILYPFMSQTWHFLNNNVAQLKNCVAPEDLNDFGLQAYIEMRQEDIYPYYEKATIGVAKFLFNEKFDKTYNRKLQRRRWMLDVAVKSFVASLFCWYLFVKLNIIQLAINYVHDNYFA